MRRLFSAGHVYPTLGTLAEVAAALGMRLILEPLEAGEQRHLTEPLRRGNASDPIALARHLDALRNQPHDKAATA